MGTRVSFKEAGVSLTCRGQEVAIGHARRGIYVLNMGGGTAMAATAETDASLTWHPRFGHAGGAALARIPAAVEGMKANPTALPSK